MATIKFGVENIDVGLVHNSNYYQTAKHLCRFCEERFLANIFIIDVSPSFRIPNYVDILLNSCRDTLWRGVDVRIIIGGARNNFSINEACITSILRAHDLGLPCKLLSNSTHASSHKKYLISDDYILIGSHNWSPGAFSHQTQDSVLVKSHALSTYLYINFAKEWAIAS